MRRADVAARGLLVAAAGIGFVLSSAAVADKNGGLHGFVLLGSAADDQKLEGVVDRDGNLHVPSLDSGTRWPSFTTQGGGR